MKPTSYPGLLGLLRCQKPWDNPCIFPKKWVIAGGLCLNKMLTKGYYARSEELRISCIFDEFYIILILLCIDSIVWCFYLYPMICLASNYVLICLNCNMIGYSVFAIFWNMASRLEDDLFQVALSKSLEKLNKVGKLSRLKINNMKRCCRCFWTIREDVKVIVKEYLVAFINTRLKGNYLFGQLSHNCSSKKLKELGLINITHCQSLNENDYKTLDLGRYRTQYA